MPTLRRTVLPQSSRRSLNRAVNTQRAFFPWSAGLIMTRFLSRVSPRSRCCSSPVATDTATGRTNTHPPKILFEERSFWLGLWQLCPRDPSVHHLDGLLFAHLALIDSRILA